ncbi:hypothetical protein H8M03_11710 [Sphingomonas sabuli]|uniref:Uncharacterized protein n=1 Tax=Sphingomonas sabuli TaxID=2764186 RepID=A0A7G9L1Z7_9SPHN|nr:hypothetical protein [Sphingomonas sabuli]QNM82646.1 hypothetical protein H8M03_11710 [Sphingomonas sabuli]
MFLRLPILLAAAIALSPAPALAQAGRFLIVNNTDIDFSAVQVRPVGSNQWLPLVVKPVPVTRSGGQGNVDFNNPECAFDLQATLPDGRVVVWSRLNLCETKAVTLNRSASGELWADYR